jgi:hypothetical protein
MGRISPAVSLEVAPTYRSLAKEKNYSPTFKDCKLF